MLSVPGIFVYAPHLATNGADSRHDNEILNTSSTGVASMTMNIFLLMHCV